MSLTRASTGRLTWVVVSGCLLGLSLSGAAGSHSPAASDSGYSASVSLHLMGKQASRTLGQHVERTMGRIAPRIERDFRVRMPRLAIRLFGSDSRFARQLIRLQGEGPQSEGDQAGNVVDGTLPLGPDLRKIPHTLAHVYTEWVLDRLTGNLEDREPSPAWLYDGLAEVEASRIAPRGTCRLAGRTPIPLPLLTTPTQWRRVRGTPLQGLEYCEAREAAASLLRRTGWAHCLQLVHENLSFARFAAHLLAASPNH